MTLPRMYYEVTERPYHLMLHLFDGTTRDVIFRDETAKSAALIDGRAAIDCTAIENGLLPSGATFVSRARASDAAALVDQLRDPADAGPHDPLAATRLAFSMKLLVKRSEHIDGLRDAEARRADPLSARRYDGIVKLLMDSVGRDMTDHG